MLRRNIYITVMMLVSASHFLFADKVYVDFEYHLGDRVAHGTCVLDLKGRLSLSMEGESLGLLIRLVNSTKGHEVFEITPTNNETPLKRYRAYAGAQLALREGVRFNNLHVLNKELAIKFLNVKHIEPDVVK